MIFDIDQSNFASTGQWLVWRLGLDMAVPGVTTIGTVPDSASSERAERDLYGFIRDLYADVYASPDAYGVPNFPFYPALIKETVGDTEVFRKAVLSVRRILCDGIIDFLLQLGLMGHVDGREMTVERAEYERLLEAKQKKCKSLVFLRALDERLGLHPECTEQVTFKNIKYPAMFQGLSLLGKACASDKKYGEYIFRRCDFRGIAPGYAPELGDALQIIPGPGRADIQAADALLASRGFKREIMVAEVSDGYRIRYSRRADRIVYWLRLRQMCRPTVYHHVRWELGQSTENLMPIMEAKLPGSARAIIDGLCLCAHCRQTCGSRRTVRWNNLTIQACSEVGWIGSPDHDGFGMAGELLAALDDLVSSSPAK